MFAPAADVRRVACAVGEPTRPPVIVPRPEGGEIDLDLDRAAETAAAHNSARLVTSTSSGRRKVLVRTAHARVTKLSMTRLAPALSKSMVSLLPSTALTRP